MLKTNRKYYFLMLGVLAALSAYPVVMGAKIIILQWQNGGIRPEDYARYVIPYTAICLAVLIAAALYPILSRLKRLPVLAATVLALGLFVGIELLMESITIYSPSAQNAARLQLLSCIYTPAATKSFLLLYNETYKIHYFLISFVIIALVINIAYGYGYLFSSGDRKNIIPLKLQLAVTVLLILLCIFANFTGFYRERTDYLSPVVFIVNWRIFYCVRYFFRCLFRELAYQKRQGAIRVAARRSGHPRVLRHVLRGISPAGRHAVPVRVILLF